MSESVETAQAKEYAAKYVEAFESSSYEDSLDPVGRAKPYMTNNWAVHLRETTLSASKSPILKQIKSDDEVWVAKVDSVTEWGENRWRVQGHTRRPGQDRNLDYVLTMVRQNGIWLVSSVDDLGSYPLP